MKLTAEQNALMTRLTAPTLDVEKIKESLNGVDSLFEWNIFRIYFGPENERQNNFHDACNPLHLLFDMSAYHDDKYKEEAKQYAENVRAAFDLLMDHDVGVSQLNKVGIYGMTPLSCLLINGKYFKKDLRYMVEKLISCGADITQPFRGETPFWTACRYWHHEVLDLLYNPETIDQRDEEHGYNALHYAMSGDPKNDSSKYNEKGRLTKWFDNDDHLKTIDFLLEHGANPDAFTHEQLSPLALALRNKSPQAAAKFIAAGVDPYEKDDKGKYFVYRGLDEKETDMAQVVLYAAMLHNLIVNPLEAKIDELNKKNEGKQYDHVIKELNTVIGLASDASFKYETGFDLTDNQFFGFHYDLKHALEEAIKDSQIQFPDKRFFLYALLGTLITFTVVGALLWFSKRYRHLMINTELGRQLSICLSNLQTIEKRFGLQETSLKRLKRAFSEKNSFVKQVEAAAKEINYGVNPFVKDKTGKFVVFSHCSAHETKIYKQILYIAYLEAKIFDRFDKKIEQLETELKYYPSDTSIQPRIDILKQARDEVSDEVEKVNQGDWPKDEELFAQMHTNIQTILMAHANHDVTKKYDMRRFFLTLIAVLFSLTVIGMFAWVSKRARNYMFNSSEGYLLGDAKLSLTDLEKNFKIGAPPPAPAGG